VDFVVLKAEKEFINVVLLMTTKISDDVVVAPASDDKLDYYCFIASLSEAAKDADTSDITYGKKMLPKGPVKDTFDGHHRMMFVEFSKAANKSTG
jgi:hypothetical protein